MGRGGGTRGRWRRGDAGGVKEEGRGRKRKEEGNPQRDVQVERGGGERPRRQSVWGTREVLHLFRASPWGRRSPRHPLLHDSTPVPCRPPSFSTECEVILTPVSPEGQDGHSPARRAFTDSRTICGDCREHVRSCALPTSLVKMFGDGPLPAGGRGPWLEQGGVVTTGADTTGACWGCGCLAGYPLERGCVGPDEDLAGGLEGEAGKGTDNAGLSSLTSGWREGCEAGLTSLGLGPLRRDK